MNKKVGRNDPCSCGSGKKYKKCCEAKHKYKKFDAKVLSSSAGVAGAIFNQSQSVSGLFNRKIQAITPKKTETSLKERASSSSPAGAQTNEVPGEAGAQTNEVPGEAGAQTNEVPGEAGAQTNEVPGEAGAQTNEVPGEAGAQTRETPEEDSKEKGEEQENKDAE